MMEPRVFIWRGVPRGQGRPRFTRTGRAYKAEKDRAYEQSIKAAYLKEYGQESPIDGPFEIVVGAWVPIPKNATRNKRLDMLARRIRPTVKPDMDNVVKAVLDALNGVAYIDDKALVSLSAWKMYSMDTGLLVKIAPVEAAGA